MTEKATAGQEIKLIRKMIAQLEKQLRKCLTEEHRERYQTKLKKYTQRLRELSMKTAIAEENEEDEYYCEEKNASNATLSTEEDHSFSSLIGDSPSESTLLLSPASSPKPAGGSPRRSPVKMTTPVKLPFNMIQRSVDTNGNQIIKLGIQ